MVVNSSIHALAYQSEVNLKQALEAEESSRNAHAELNLARNEINQLKNDAQAKKELLTLLMSKKKELEERETALKREVENLEAHVKERTELLLQAMEEAKVKAVEEYKSSVELQERPVKAGTTGYHKGFKLSRWLT
ncbi:PREDICTED: uncharacterized protein LOC109114587 [Nelumbo nucifera]|uniref:Uncharacterized protein LOC109114587 n=1 Tax=Nelumbo nucifera TaxID=4432 RepID=A0A1U8Q4S8_NELNU|nr:PREDICTED: uncharacterized protein LOC109114587 [Nelumbo nucifera]